MKRALAAFVMIACVAPSAPVAPSSSTRSGDDLPRSTPAAEGMREDELVKLTKFIRDTPRLPVFSILISRHGKLVYELYTGGIDRDDAHYLMSVTKSVLSALIGIAIGRGAMKPAETSIVDFFPRSVLASDDDRARLAPLTLARVMGMSGLDAPDPPRDTSPDATARYQRFFGSHNRVAHALTEPVLAEGFQYNDSTPALAIGALEYAVNETALEFAEKHLFGPLGFKSFEWMHEDPSGIDNAGYGLRLRPIDMQKFGVTYLQGGVFDQKQIVPRAWVEQSFHAWNKSKPDKPEPDYGWFWWRYDFGPRWVALVANGWKGQRIAIFPDQDIVLTTTACMEEGEHDFFAQLVTRVLEPSIENGAGATHTRELDDLVASVAREPPRFGDFIQYRMVPSKSAKQSHHPFRP